MKNLLFILMISLVILSCQSEQEGTTETWWINSARVDCTGAGPQTCYQIFKGTELDRNNWELFYSEIEGFDYQPGSIYQIRVQVTNKSEPIPADASSKNYKLLEVISQETDPALRITNVWKVTEVGKIENPKGMKNEEDLIFEFNATERTYFGNMGCNTVRGQIKENDGENLVLGPGATTKMACPDMNSEQAISQALIDTRKYKVENRELHLLDENENTLIKLMAVD